MIKVHTGVYLIGGYGFTRPDDCLIYLLDGGEEMAMIDCGLGVSVPLLYRNIESLGLEKERLKYVVATHGHIDHIGGLAALKKQGVQVVAHAGDLPAIEENNPYLNAAVYYGVDYRPVKVDIVMREETMELSVGKVNLCLLHTPGHTPGSIAAYADIDGKRILFGQDVHGPFDRAWRSDIGQWRKSMQLLLDLQADILCEGHYGVMEGRERVEDFIRQHLRAHPV